MRPVPSIITATVGILMIIAVFVPPMQTWQSKVEIWFTILAAMAFLVGGANLCLHHWQKIWRQEAGWGFSLITLLAFIITLSVGLTKYGAPPSPNYPDYPWSGSYQEEGTAFWWIYEYIYSPIVATMFSLLAFYVASAAFRAFRAKNLEASLLLGTAFIVLLGRTYAGTVLTSWVPEEYPALTLPGLTALIMGVFTTAGQRAIMIGIALGVVAISLRIIMGLDRSYLGADEEA